MLRAIYFKTAEPFPPFFLFFFFLSFFHAKSGRRINVFETRPPPLRPFSPDLSATSLSQPKYSIPRNFQCTWLPCSRLDFFLPPYSFFFTGFGIFFLLEYSSMLVEKVLQVAIVSPINHLWNVIWNFEEFSRVKRDSSWNDPFRCNLRKNVAFSL